MSRVEYVVTYHGKEIKQRTFKTYPEIKEAVEKLGSGFSYVTKYVPYDPEDTEEKREHTKKCREKFLAARHQKKLEHALECLNLDGIGAY